jgi:glycosyltransferase involved in cell wall biosynthesis
LSTPLVFPEAPAQPVGRNTRIGVLSPYPPAAGALATFSAALTDAFTEHGVDVEVVRIADGSTSSRSEVVAELADGSAASIEACLDVLNRNDVVLVHYDYDSYGSVDSENVLAVIGGLRVPSVVVAHTIPMTPAHHECSVLETIAMVAGRVVVKSPVAERRLCSEYLVDRRKVVTIPHGADVPNGSPAKRPSRPTMLTWGLLGPGKGVERVIEAMPSLKDLPGRPRYLIAGPTHPSVLAVDGEAYREARTEQARRRGVDDSVSLDGRYWGRSSLTALIQSAAVVVLPYDSEDKAASGALVNAIASGRPVVATAFPHAVELLCSGAGIVVGHNDPDAMASALRSVLTQPRLAGSMAAEARRLAPDMAWPAVADAYLHLARRLIDERKAVR